MGESAQRNRAGRPRRRGFAFTENILYYGRVYRYAARTFGEVPLLEALQSLFVMRGGSLASAIRLLLQ